jgi:hypothetical protein
MDPKIIDVLNRPFRQDQIKTRRGRSGTSLDYVEGASVIRRLNDAFDHDWSFEVLEHRLTDNEAIVVGRLTALGFSKTQFGCSSIVKSKKDGSPIQLGDDLKSAATDAMKKAASLFGVGLHLWLEDEGRSVAEPAKKREYGKAQPAKPTKAPMTKPTHRISDTYKPDKATEKQINAISAIARSKGITKEEIEKKAGIPIRDMTKEQASEAIEWLKGSGAPQSCTPQLRDTRSDAQMRMIQALRGNLNLSMDDIRPLWGGGSSRDLTVKQASDTIEELQGMMGSKDRRTQ